MVGLNVTRALTVKYQDNLSAGRVQTPTLALVETKKEKSKRLNHKHIFSILLNVEKEQAKMAQKNQFALKSQGSASTGSTFKPTKRERFIY